MFNAKYITHCGYSIENNIASDIRLSHNVWSTRDLKDHNDSSAAATLRQALKYIVSKRFLYSMF